MKSNRKSLSWFINRRIKVIYLVVLAISIPLIYFMAAAQHKKEVETDLRDLLVTLQRLSGKQAEQVDGKMRFPDQITQFLKHHGSYYYHFLDASSQTAGREMGGEGAKLISQFSRDTALNSAAGTMTNELLDLVYIAHPWRDSGKLESIEVIGINLKSQNDKILVRVITFIGLVTIIYAIIISSINTALRKHVINPLIRINNRTNSVANGEVGKVFETKRQDEIGELIRSIELLRRSLEISMNMMKNK